MIEVKRGIAAARGAEVRMSAAAREPKGRIPAAARGAEVRMSAAAREPKGRMAVASEAQSDAPRNATG